MSAEELKEYETQLATIEEDLLEDPTNQSLIDLKGELTDLICLIREAVNEGIADDSKEDHKEGTFDSEKPLEDDPTNKYFLNENLESTKEFQRFNVGDIILAKWLTGDKQYYKAKVTSVTGSSHKPLYTVRFIRKDIKIVETVNSDCVRTLPQNRNKSVNTVLKAQARPHIQAETSSISKLQSADGGQSELGKTKPKHLPSKSQLLDTNKQKWQEFTKKGLKMGKGIKSKKLGESSMFQSPLGTTGKVGVVNSGRGVTKPKPRVRHVFDSMTRID